MAACVGISINKVIQSLREVQELKIGLLPWLLSFGVN